MNKPSIESYLNSLEPYKFNHFYHPNKMQWIKFSAEELTILGEDQEVKKFIEQYSGSQQYKENSQFIENLLTAIKVTKITDELMKRLINGK